ncbi:hypothetical protein B7463_g1324, partial [Scytalidium lignicola]
MPALVLHLLTLSVPLNSFLQTLITTDLNPVTVAKPHRWIIRPTSISTALLTKDWDLLLILPTSDTSLPSKLKPFITAQWTITFGMPSALFKDYASKNARLQHPEPGDVPPLTGSLDEGKRLIADSAQKLELDPELLKWIESFSPEGGEGHGKAMSMLNLLAFKDDMHESYLRYGKAFAESAGSRRGGLAKIVGKVINVIGFGESGEKEWDEMTLAHYPSIWHFADMLASEDYQEANKKHRVPALKDTFILCTTEVDFPVPGEKARL